MSSLVSASAAAEKMGVPQTTFSGWLRRGRVPGAIKVSNMWLVPADIKIEDIERPRMGRPRKKKENDAGNDDTATNGEDVTRPID